MSDDTSDPTPEPVQLPLPGFDPPVASNFDQGQNAFLTYYPPTHPSMLSTATYSTLSMVSHFPSATTPVPDEGIKLGEIEAWRCWRVRNDQLFSTFSTYKGGMWPPGEVLTAEMTDESIGIHAWKEQKNAVRYLDDLCSYHPAEPIAIGRVHLWGRIIEHELGYLAEHARVVSVDGIYGSYPNTLQIVRDNYELPHTPSLDIEKMIQADMGVPHRARLRSSRCHMVAFIVSTLFASANIWAATHNYIFGGSLTTFTINLVVALVCLIIARLCRRWKQ